MRRRSQRAFGKTCYPGGRKIEITSEHQEWVEWAAKTLELAAEKEAAAQFRAQEYRGSVPL